MLTRIRNSCLARHSLSRVYYSKLNIAILKVLQAEGYIHSYTIEKKENSHLFIKIYLKYKGWWIKKPLFSNLQRISKPGKRVFSGYKNFQKFIDVLRFEQGIAIISTSSGVMSHIKASQLKKGGEILCFIG
uniref:Ribosomal protein S8 n=1 Tax=Mallomonas splendens TaxID=52552 RepID=A0A3G2QZK2_9STRA|nr:ribosomal protein S8 [Mallomonas splendens]AYO28570.1 ribosomal protein S8 [Mallomonas splendens]